MEVYIKSWGKVTLDAYANRDAWLRGYLINNGIALAMANMTCQLNANGESFDYYHPVYDMVRTHKVGPLSGMGEVTWETVPYGDEYPIESGVLGWCHDRLYAIVGVGNKRVWAHNLSWPSGTSVVLDTYEIKRAKIISITLY